MLAGGGDLVEVGQVLRDGRAETTAIYAKSTESCSDELVRPWPGAWHDPDPTSRRGLPVGAPVTGYKLVDHGWLLADFAAYMETAGATTITVPWHWPGPPCPRTSCPRGGPPACGSSGASPATCSAFDPDTEIPPVGLLEARNRRAVPYLYSKDEVAALLAATGSLRPALHAATYRTAHRPVGSHRDAPR